MPIGTIVSFPKESLPRDFCECDGKEYSVEDKNELYAVIRGQYGYRIGEDKKTYFNVPDYRGFFLRGWDHADAFGAAQEDTTRLPRTGFTAKEGGEHTHETLTSGVHTHGMAPDGAHAHGFDGLGLGPDAVDMWFHRNTGFTRIEYVLRGRSTAASDNHAHTIYKDGVHSHKIDRSGKHSHAVIGGDKETRPKNKNVKFMIKCKPSIINVQEELATLKQQATAIEQELKETQESVQKIYQAGLFFSTAVVTGVAGVVTAKYFRR